MVDVEAFNRAFPTRIGSDVEEVLFEARCAKRPTPLRKGRASPGKLALVALYASCVTLPADFVMPLFCALRGHAWTILPTLGSMLRKCRTPAFLPWTTTLHEAPRGEVTLRGELRLPTGAAAICVLVHGLGGSHASPYLQQAAAALHERGIATLALSLRGADGGGGDIYHAALTADLDAALCSPELQPFQRVHVLGFSLGGHLALRYAMAPGDHRVRSVAAICAPVDLALAQQHLDRRRCALYRRFVLHSLRLHHSACSSRGRGIVDLAVARRIQTLRDWDARIVVPRFGFGSVDNYYASASVAPHLTALRVPSLLVLAAGDPMVPPAVVRPRLPTAEGALCVRWTRRGGHLGLPRDLDLGLGADRGLHGQVVGFFRR